MSETLLQVRGLKKYFPVRGGVFLRQVGNVHAVEDVSFSVDRGKTLGLVGESGCGKSTVGHTILNLHSPTAGNIFYEGRDIATMNRAELKDLRRNVQIIFQDPFESLNARHTVSRILEEPFLIHDLGTSAERRDWASDLLHRVGLQADALDRFPHEFSGGQRQRIGIARAIALKPKLVVCDEAVSALDVSIQAQIINLLEELQEQFELTFLFIAHDLSVVRHISDRVGVMYLGHMVEIADRNEIYVNPVHPYTKALLSAVPIPDPVLDAQRERVLLSGEVPSPLNPPSGCVFHPRCPVATDECNTVVPELREVASGHWASCINVPGYGAY